MNAGLVRDWLRKLQIRDWIALTVVTIWGVVGIAFVAAAIPEDNQPGWSARSLSEDLSWVFMVGGLIVGPVVGFYFSRRNSASHAATGVHVALFSLLGIILIVVATVAYFSVASLYTKGHEDGVVALKQVIPLLLPYVTMSIAFFFPDADDPPASTADSGVPQEPNA